MTHLKNDTVPILSPAPLLRRAKHFAARIDGMTSTASPLETEKCAKAMAELYKTATLMQTFNAQEAQRNETADYDNFPAPSPEQEAALREELLGYYEGIHEEQLESEAAAGPSERETASGVQGDVAAHSP